MAAAQIELATLATHPEAVGATSSQRSVAVSALSFRWAVT